MYLLPAPESGHRGVDELYLRAEGGFVLGKMDEVEARGAFQRGTRSGPLFYKDGVHYGVAGGAKDVDEVRADFVHRAENRLRAGYRIRRRIVTEKWRPYLVAGDRWFFHYLVKPVHNVPLERDDAAQQYADAVAARRAGG